MAVQSTNEGSGDKMSSATPQVTKTVRLNLPPVDTEDSVNSQTHRHAFLTTRRSNDVAYPTRQSGDTPKSSTTHKDEEDHKDDPPASNQQQGNFAMPPASVAPDTVSFWGGADPSRADPADEKENSLKAILARAIDADYFLPRDDSSEEEQFQAAVTRESTLGYMYESGVADDNARLALEDDDAVRHVSDEVESDCQVAGPVTSSDLLLAREQRIQAQLEKLEVLKREIRAGLRHVQLGIEASKLGLRQIRRIRAIASQNITHDSVSETRYLYDHLQRVRGARVAKPTQLGPHRMQAARRAREKRERAELMEREQELARIGRERAQAAAQAPRRQLRQYSNDPQERERQIRAEEAASEMQMFRLG